MNIKEIPQKWIDTFNRLGSEGVWNLPLIIKTYLIGMN